MKYCEVSEKCPWGHSLYPNQCGYKEDIKEDNLWHNLVIMANFGFMLTQLPYKKYKKEVWYFIWEEK